MTARLSKLPTSIKTLALVFWTSTLLLACSSGTNGIGYFSYAYYAEY